MPNSRPEAPAVAARNVVLTAIGLMAFVGISLVVLHFYYNEEISETVFMPPTAFSKPRLQTNDARDLAELQAAQRRRLSGYAWVDREKGIVAIPIEESMKRVVARGSEAYGPIAPVTPAQQHPDTSGAEQP
jgi:hypothetical protein